MKKIVSLCIVFIMLITLIGCNEKHTESGKDVSASKEVDSISYETLTIEYDVEDYVENAIIVSKNDGLVYGLLDNEGNEIIPVKYDDMEFLNKDDYIDGYFDLYIRCAYEDTEYVFDIDGKKLTESKGSIEYADSIFKNAKAPVFVINNSGSYELFNKELVKIGTLPQNEKIIISNRCCLVSVIFFENNDLRSNSYIYNFSGNVLEDFGELTFVHFAYADNKCILFFIEENSYSDLTPGKAYHIGESGNILSIEDITSGEFIKKYVNRKQYNLYKTNSTYKMEDLNGNPLYKERYYKEYNVSGHNDCIFLTDENDSICIFGRQGKLYAEFGDLTVKNDELYLTTQNRNFEINAIHEGKESVAVVISESGGSEIHFYSE